MPKETVYGASPPFGDENPATAVVEVGWNRETGHMQIVTKCVHSADESPITPPDVTSETRSSGTIHYTDGFYVDLDRSGINRLIQNLRRARDQAFGRDE